MHAKYREGPVKESAVEGAFTRRLTDRRFRGVAIKINIMGRRSWPDRLVIGHGRLFEFVEFKRPGDKLRLGQSLIHQMLRRWGFEPVTCDNAADARLLADKYLAYCGTYKEGEDGHNEIQDKAKAQAAEDAAGRRARRGRAA